MANKTLTTSGARVAQVEQLYYSPVAVVPPLTEIPLATLYCFLAKVDPWPDDNNPPAPTQDVKSLKTIFKNIFAARHITTNDISPVIKRINWTSGIMYDYYDDSVDMGELDSNGNLVKTFYVKNKYDQVFKCLWNNNAAVTDAVSTIEPYFEPGTYNTNNIFLGSDGYKWKYLYTIDIGSKLKFMDNTWMPVAVGSNTPNPNTTAGAGSIDVINVVDGGQLYDPSNNIIYVTITGDGTGATGTAVVDGNAITDITVNTPGSGYTYANVAITSSAGFGAHAIAPASPIGGHGFDPISELACTNVMVSVEFNGSEGGIIPTDIDYHQLGIITNPTLKSLKDSQYGYVPASGDIYKVTTDFIVAPGFGVYQNDETIYQGDESNPSFFGTILSFDPGSDVIRVLNITGTPTTNAPIKGATSKTTRTLLQYVEPDFQIFSGYISYIENRTGVQRSSDGIEQYRFVIGY
jgi:hypothetical protein